MHPNSLQIFHQSIKTVLIPTDLNARAILLHTQVVLTVPRGVCIQVLTLPSVRVSPITKEKMRENVCLKEHIQSTYYSYDN
jgi:hypothetical protein